MYFVYKVEIGQYVYVGCTNFLRRRKDQHNENARLRRSKFGCFLADNGIVLNTEDLEVLFTFENREDAFKAEKRTTIDYEQSGMYLLNDNYSKNCTRKGKNTGHTCKRFVVIDAYEHTATEIEDLRQYSMQIGINYKCLHSTQKGSFYKRRYMVMSPESWETEKDKDLYLSGEIIDIKRNEGYSRGASKNAKRYLVLTPENDVVEVKNLDAFAREHNINSGNLHASFSTPHKANGYKVIKRI